MDGPNETGQTSQQNDIARFFPTSPNSSEKPQYTLQLDKKVGEKGRLTTASSTIPEGKVRVSRLQLPNGNSLITIQKNTGLVSTSGELRFIEKDGKTRTFGFRGPIEGVSDLFEIQNKEGQQIEIPFGDNASVKFTGNVDHAFAQVVFPENDYRGVQHEIESKTLGNYYDDKLGKEVKELAKEFAQDAKPKPPVLEAGFEPASACLRR